MNNKGFTLIELLVSIALIAIISLIITPTVTSTIKNNKIKACEKMFASVEEAARAYVSDNRYNVISAFNSCNNTKLKGTVGCKISSVDLKDKGYLTKEIKNPLNNNPLTITVTVKFGSNKKYTYTLSPTSATTCK